MQIEAIRKTQTEGILEMENLGKTFFETYKTRSEQQSEWTRTQNTSTK